MTCMLQGWAQHLDKWKGNGGAGKPMMVMASYDRVYATREGLNSLPLPSIAVLCQQRS